MKTKDTPAFADYKAFAGVSLFMTRKAIEGTIHRAYFPKWNYSQKTTLTNSK